MLVTGEADVQIQLCYILQHPLTTKGEMGELEG